MDLFMKEFYYPESTDYTPIVYKIDGADLNQMETGGLDANFELHGADVSLHQAHMRQDARLRFKISSISNLLLD